MTSSKGEESIMDYENRDEEVADIMTEIANRLLKDGPLPLESVTDSYKGEEMGPFLIAFSRMEAEGMIVRDMDGKWRWNGPAVMDADYDVSTPFKVVLYRDTGVENLDLDEISEYLDDKSYVDGSLVREDYFDGLEYGGLSEKLSDCLIEDITRRRSDSKSDTKKVKKFDCSKDGDKSGFLYDGMCLRRGYLDLIPEEERNEDFLHIFFTDRFFGTWKPATQRYHARISVYGFPSVVSTTGIVDAPARPRGLYRIERGKDGLDITKTRETASVGDYTAYDDRRMTEIMKGYTMQAVAYHVSSWPFCEDNECRLYNPHLQANLLRAQLSEPEFCDRHRRFQS